MNWEAWLTVGVVAACVLLLALSIVTPELVLFGGLVVLLTSGILTPTQALAGFANEGLITVALLYVVAAGIRETGGMDFLVHHVLGRPRGIRQAQWRLMLPTMVMSGFLNNTPVVATFIPAVLSWARQLDHSPSRLLLPLSYAAILGGVCTLIGTSTNLIVNGLLISELNAPGMNMFDITWVGLPCALVGLGYVLLWGGRRLPERVPVAAVFENPREYTVEMRVEPRGHLVGKTVEEAGLRHLRGLYLVEIERDGRIIAAVGHHERLRAEDRLIFVGVPESVVELRKFKGLSPSAEPAFSLEEHFPERCLVEVVVSPRCGLLGRTIKEGRFRSVYGASVIAVARHGQRILGKVGNIRLQPADTLLLETRPSFVERHRNSRDFLLVSPLSDFSTPRFERAWLAWIILGGIVLTAGIGLSSMLNAAMLGAIAMLLTGCCPVPVARRSIDTQVLLAIASAFALGKALDVTGAAHTLAEAFLGLAGGHPWLALVLTYLLTSFLTEIVTNNAVAVLMFPIVVAAAQGMGVDPMPFVVAVMVGASASFSTPIGYQTNLMVYGPGGYRFSDYLRIGIPLNLLVGFTAVLIIP
ncbi:MAG: SLC13 family permease, partial [Candidatus Competibacteraceae bacterium]|nr:SLC13 family permease [Candidatus Competibacteraceae bacterium]